MNTTELMTAEEVAERLKVRARTIHNWTQRGLIPTIRLSPKIVRYNLAAVIEAMTQRQIVKATDGRKEVENE